MIRLLVCDDQSTTRAGLAMILRLEPDIEIVGLACDGAEALELTEGLQPDLVLMDLKMPHVNGIEATRLIRAQHPQIFVLVLTTYDDDEWLIEAIRAGAHGYLLKDAPRSDLVDAVRGTVSGKNYIDPGVTGKLLQQVVTGQQHPSSDLTSKLTEREVAVLGLIANGLSNAAIAARLSLSEGTVRNHVSSILAKLNLADRTQAAVLAMRHGVIADATR